MRGQARGFRLLSLPTLPALLLVAAAPLAADNGQGQIVPAVAVEKVVKLQALPEAEVKVPGFQAVFLSDGSVTISGQGSVKAGAPAQGFDFEVDLVRGTYVTRELEPGEIQERKPQVETSGKGGLKLPVNQLDAVIAAVSPGTWSGSVRVQTKDPVLVVLTETTTRLTWVVHSNGTVSWQSYSDGCWAANPSSLGTHWFVSSCQGGAPWYASTTRVCNDNRGSYYNYDFAFDDQITTASQWTWMCGRNDAVYDYNWSHNDGGEGALLIFGSVIVG